MDSTRAADEEIAETHILREYVALCEYVRLFLDAHLRSEDKAFGVRTSEYVSTPLGKPSFHVEHVPRGTDGPEAFAIDGEQGPTPRQLRPLIDELGIERAITVLAAHQGGEPRSPIYSSTMLTGSLVFELYEEGRRDDARLLYEYFRDVPVNVMGNLSFLTDLSEWSGRRDRALRFLRVATFLDPEDLALAARLDKLEAENED